MSTTAAARPPGNAIKRLDLGHRNPLLLLMVFLLIGFGITSLITLASGSSLKILVFSAAALVFAPPTVYLGIKAIPQAWQRARELAADWSWWHPLWFFLFFSMLVFRIRDVAAAGSNPLDAYAMLRVLPEAAVAIVLLVRLVLRKPNWLGTLFHGLTGAMAIYCLVCLTSTAWSVKPSWTAYKSLEFLMDVSLLAAIIATAESWLTFKKLVDWTLTFYGLSLVGVWLNIPFWPGDAFDGGRLTGVYPVEASNSVGTSGAVLSLVALCRLMPLWGQTRARAWYMFLFLFGFVSMVLSQTRNAEAAWVAGVGLIALFSPKVRKWTITTVAFGTPVLLASVLLSNRLWAKAADIAIGFLAREQSSGAIDSLSGRTAWWAYGIEQLLHHPLTGMGAYAAGRFAVLGKLGVGSAAMMHSDWIEIVIGTSFWGLIPFVAALGGAWYLLIRCLRDKRMFTVEQRQLAMELLAVLALLTLHSFFNNELAWHVPLMYFATLGYAEYIRRNRFRRPYEAAMVANA